jgi:excisionase family DNA binding protein
MDLLTVPEAAALLRVATITVRRRIADGSIKAVRVGKGLRIPREALERFIEPVGPDDPLRVAEPPAPAYGTSTQEAVYLSDILTARQAMKLTPEEKQRATQAIEEARQALEEEHKQRGGKPWPSSWRVINRERDKRTRHLMRLMRPTE